MKLNYLVYIIAICLISLSQRTTYLSYKLHRIVLFSKLFIHLALDYDFNTFKHKQRARAMTCPLSMPKNHQSCVLHSCLTVSNLFTGAFRYRGTLNNLFAPIRKTKKENCQSYGSVQFRLVNYTKDSELFRESDLSFFGLQPQ